MLNLSFLIQLLHPFVVGMPCLERTFAPDRVELLAGQKRLTADRVYLADCAEPEWLKDCEIEPGVFLLLARANRDIQGKVPLQRGSLACFSCSLATLYNTIAELTSRLDHWRDAYWAQSEKNADMQSLVSLTAQLGGGPAVVVSRQGNIVVSAGLEPDHYLNRYLEKEGDCLNRLEHWLFGDDLGAVHRKRPVEGSDAVLYGCRIGDGYHRFGSLIVEGRRGEKAVDLESLCICGARYLKQQLCSYGMQEMEQSREDFRRCWEQIMDRTLTGAVEIRVALSRVCKSVKPFVQLVVIHFQQTQNDLPYRYLLARLQEIFPDGSLALYRKDVVVLHSYEERTFRGAEDYQSNRPLLELLEQYDGCAIVSNGTRRLEALRSVFQLAQRAALMARALRKSGDPRVYSQEQYGIYCIIDLCVQRYLEIEGNEDILYLLHPAIIHLTRYDLEHNNNLRKVLYYYLLNDRNLVKTASATFMHRNTVINKVNKIQGLLNLDLEDGQLRQKLIMSCQFIQYYECVMKREFRP